MKQRFSGFQHRPVTTERWKIKEEDPTKASVCCQKEFEGGPK